MIHQNGRNFGPCAFSHEVYDGRWSGGQRRRAYRQSGISSTDTSLCGELTHNKEGRPASSEDARVEFMGSLHASFSLSNLNRLDFMLKLNTRQ